MSTSIVGPNTASDPTESRLAETYPGSFEELLAEHGEDWGLNAILRGASPWGTATTTPSKE